MSNRRTWSYLLWALLLAIGVCPINGEELASLPRLTSRVTDTAGLLSPAQRQELEALLKGFERRKGAQIALVIVPSTKPESIEGYSIRLAEAWKIGRKKIDDGAILLIAKEDQKLRIEVGYGLEGVLNDITANRIIQDIIVPLFKQKDFYAGIKSGLTAMIRVIDGEKLPRPKSTLSRRGFGGGAILLLGLLIASGFLIRSLLGGGIAFFINILIGAVLGYFFLSWISGLLLATFASMAAFARGSYFGGMGYHYGGYGGGFGRGGGGFGGGFGGGGGSFGGGGASGSW